MWRHRRDGMRIAVWAWLAAGVVCLPRCGLAAERDVERNFAAAAAAATADLDDFGPDEAFSEETAFPETSGEDVDPLAAQVRILQERLARLEARDRTFEPISAQDKGKGDKEKSGKEDKKPADEWVDISDEKWTVKLGGHVQLDYITWANADPAIDGADNYFNFRRLRLWADGTGYGQFDFRLQMTLEPGSGPASSVNFFSPDVKDAYFSMNDIPWLGRFRVGNFFVPFSLEQVTNDTNNIFNERSIPTQGVFAADREVGMALYNCTPDQRVTWTTGIFFDDVSDTIKTEIDNNQGYRLSGRLTWLPYYDEPSNGRYLIHTGIGVLYTNDQDDIARFRTRPQIQRGPIVLDTGNIAATSNTAANVELAVVSGPVTLQAEAFRCSVNTLAGDGLNLDGAYAHVSYFLTGENRIFERFGQHGAQFARNKPFENFFITKGGFGTGAIESKVRWSYLDFHEANAGTYHDVTAGFNWYWTERTRVMFDWIHPITSDQAVFGSTRSDLLAMRFDFNW